jgi:hypothetical protein
MKTHTWFLAAFLALLSAWLALPEAAAQDTQDTATASPTTIAWDDATRLAVAQCLVAEARFRPRTEHSLMLHVLERRWREHAERDPAWTFEAQVRQYCHLFRDPEHSTGRWALSLPWGPMVEDPGMPVGADWRRWVDDWDFTRETVARFEAGELPDPMPLAILWGGAMDSRQSATTVWLGPTAHSVDDGAPVLLHNRFYARASAVRAAAARRARLVTP